MSEEVIVRKYKNTDYTQLCEVHDEARAQELIVGNIVELYTPSEEAVYKEELFSETTYIAEVNGYVIGFIAFGKGGLGYVYVLKEYRGKGVGGKLLDTAIPCLKCPAFSEVSPTNIRAKGLYGSYGFAEEVKEEMILK